MPEPIPAVESRARFIAKVAAVYLGYAALAAVFVWYLLYQNPPKVWAISGIILIFFLGMVFWFWGTRAHYQRHRAQTRAFYSKLGSELSDADSSGAVAVTMGMYTLRETLELTLMSIYRRPRIALPLILLSLLIAFSFLLVSWPPSPPQLLLALAVAIAFNGLFITTTTAATRRALERLWQGKPETVLTISPQGLTLGQRATLPWTSIDRVHETRSWIVFMRDGRRIVALPVARIPPPSLEPLRKILASAKGNHFQTA